MPQTNVTIDDDQLRGAISRLLNATGNLKPAFDDIGETALQFVQTYFDQEREPSGSPWQELAPATLARKRKRNFRMAKLQQRGVLFKTIAYAASRTDVVIGSNLVYARIHQFGGKAGRNKAVTIPARPYLSLGDDPAFIEAALGVLEDHIAGAWNG